MPDDVAALHAAHHELSAAVAKLERLSGRLKSSAPAHGYLYCHEAMADQHHDVLLHERAAGLVLDALESEPIPADVLPTAIAVVSRLVHALAQDIEHLASTVATLDDLTTPSHGSAQPLLAAALVLKRQSKQTRAAVVALIEAIEALADEAEPAAQCAHRAPRRRHRPSQPRSTCRRDSDPDPARCQGALLGAVCLTLGIHDYPRGTTTSI